MDIIELTQFAKAKLIANEQDFISKTDVVVALLRSLEVLSHTRTALTEHRHMEFAGALALAADTLGQFNLYTRKHSAIHSRGGTTRIIAWLDDCVLRGLLEQAQGLTYAKGAMIVGPMLRHYVQYAALPLTVPVERLNIKITT